MPLKCNEPGTLHNATLKLLQTDIRTISTISIAAKIPYPWLSKFNDGAIKSPSVNRIQYLFEFLSENKLPLQ